MTKSFFKKFLHNNFHSKLIITKRELAAFFASPIAYITSALFLLIAGIFTFQIFFLQNRADLRSYFSLLPLLLSFFIPALTMRMFAEEKRSGSIETLLTLPVSEVDVVFGKWFASFLESAIMISPTILFVIPLFIFGSPDVGPLVAEFIASLFLCASFSAIGVFASTTTKNQIIAFFLAFAICITLTLIDSFLIFLPSQIVSALSFISANAHFNAIARGIFDSRDVIYFVSLTVFFFALSVESETSQR